MFETAEIGSTIPEAEYAAAVPDLRVNLINAQYDLRQGDFPVVILLNGDDRVGCAELVDLFNEWMDARHIETNFFGDPTDEERQRPQFWRYWRSLPPDGRMGVYLGAWMLEAIRGRFEGDLDDEEFDRRLQRIHQFEGDLADDGALILKFWIHLPRNELKKRLKRAKKNQGRIWRLADRDWEIYRHYDAVEPFVERALRKTSTMHAVWNIVEGTDQRYRNLAVMKTIFEALAARLEAKDDAPAIGEVNPLPAAGALDAIDLTAALPYDEYKTALIRQQRRLNRLARHAYAEGMSTVLVFEGWDAAGKGGVIRRITRSMTAQLYKVVPIGAPTDEELAHHYLWRFWRQLPRAGRMLIFDRSWYGRVLVERVEGLAQPNEWQRAYEEINDFEEQLVDHGMVVLKFWLHLAPEEQLGRFRAREQTPYKKYKITDEDYRNRGKWEDYIAAVNEMVARTSTDLAPWTLVSSNDKRWARVEVLKTVNRALKRALKAR